MNFPPNKNFDSIECINNGKNCVVIKNAVCFRPSDIFDCGQCFRFNKIGNEDYDGIAFGKYIRVFSKDCDIYIENATYGDFCTIWYKFFGLDRDYKEIADSFTSFGEKEALKKAMNFCSGIRILQQEVFECLISFIISQNNNIPRIKKIVESLCRNFGDDISCDRESGKKLYAFPNAEAILHNASGLDVIKSGFRGKYIYDAAKKIMDGEIDLEAIYGMTTEEGAKYLMNIKGVGPKVASCVMLFGYNRLDAFPVDVWVKRILEKYYPSVSLPNGIYKTFGAYAGMAQQYLFYWERTTGGAGIGSE